MNLVGKIFIVLIFIASTVFMTMGIMVYSTQHNWYEAITSKGGPGMPVGFQMQLQNERGEEQKLKNEIQQYDTTLSIEKQAHFEAEAKLATERNELKTNLDHQKEELAAQQSKLEKATDALQVAQKSLTDLRKQDADLREDIRMANKATDEQLKIAQAATDKLNIAMGQLSDLKQRDTQLAGDVAKAVVLLGKLHMTIDDPVNGQPPTVRGEIIAVDKDNHAEITLGTDDGLRLGNTLEIYRGDKYLGRMQVLEAQPHRAVGKVIKELQQDVIRNGDQVATRLKA
ncbi:MAG TPA: hypothetical protein VHX65_14380 [Pirellulales bacterium]|jgi:hypothetical protein|nr:hypothetical protein [Pirellulales bacterium]